MREGIHADGSHVLRAKIDMTSPNMLMRDPVVYRIKHAAHYRRENEWPIYPLYDFAHPLSDAIEGITHSLCTLEFDVHRPLYDWLVDALFPSPRPHQYESARLNIDYTVMSKRKLLKLVQEDLVDGWDDPRMPTLSGMRRRGYPPEAIRRFCDLIGVAKANNRGGPGTPRVCCSKRAKHPRSARNVCFRPIKSRINELFLKTESSNLKPLIGLTTFPRKALERFR